MNRPPLFKANGLPVAFKPLPDRYWAKVDVRGDDECWPWTAGKDWDGYGRIKAGSHRTALAHQVGWMLEHGTNIPAGLHVLHRCDNTGCQNPRHLFLGTYDDNNQDRVRKGRSATKAAGTWHGGRPRHTHCRNGHLFTEETTAYYGRSRVCRLCRNAYQQARRATITQDEGCCVRLERA